MAAELNPARSGTLRFAFGTASAFVLCEAMGWYPTFLAPVLVAVLLGSLPAALPLRAGLALIFVQSAGAATAFALSSMLRETPTVLFGTIGLIVFLSFAIIASGRAFLPTLLVLICFSTIPIVTLAAPQEAGALPVAFIRGMALAAVTVWLVQGIWPPAAKAEPPSSVAKVEPARLALAGSAIVLPLMLVYLMFGITDALPVLITTIVLVVNFDPSRGAVQGLAMILANLIGGMVAILCHAAVDIAPSLFTLAGTAFLIGLAFGQRIARGGPLGPVALITFNQAVIMLSLGLIPGPSSTGLWVTRVLQFAIAYAFAVGLMYLMLPHGADETRRQSANASNKAHA